MLGRLAEHAHINAYYRGIYYPLGCESGLCRQTEIGRKVVCRSRRDISERRAAVFGQLHQSADYLVQGAVAAAAYYSVISRSLVERYLSGMPRRAGHSYGKVEICIAECAADGVKIVLSAHCTCFRIKYK